MLNSIANAILLSKNRRQTVKPSPTAVSTTKSGGVCHYNDQFEKIKEYSKTVEPILKSWSSDIGDYEYSYTTKKGLYSSGLYKI